MMQRLHFMDKNVRNILIRRREGKRPVGDVGLSVLAVKTVRNETV